MKSSQSKCVWVSQYHIQMSLRALQVHIISNQDQCDQEQKDQLLLHSRPHPQESVLSVHCLRLDCCQAHTRLLLNPVCHITGKKKGKLDSMLQHFSRIKRSYLNKDKTAALPDNSWWNTHSSHLLYRGNTKLLYNCEHCQGAVVWVFLFVQLVENKALTLRTVWIIAPSNCLQT